MQGVGWLLVGFTLMPTAVISRMDYNNENLQFGTKQ